MIERTHVVTIRRNSPTGGTGGQRIETLVSVATGVEMNIQPRSGELRASAAGVQVVGAYEGFCASGVNVRVDDVLEVTSGEGPGQYRVEFIGYHGSDWDMQLDLDESQESWS